MRVTRNLTCALVLAAACAAPAGAQAPANAKPAPAASPALKLPAPILAAFQKSYPNAVIKTASSEKDKGKVVWEVESTENGLGRDLVYEPDGRVVEMEEQIAVGDLPAPVTEAVKASYPKAVITKAERLTRGATLHYELQLKGAVVKAIELTPEGKKVGA